MTAHDTDHDRRDWDWDKDGDLVARYVEMRSVVVKKGPSAGKTKVVVDFHHGLDDKPVSVWETTVLKSKFLAELKARGADDFKPGEQMTITPIGWKPSPSGGDYRDFDIEFEFAAPRKTAAQMLATAGGENGEPEMAADEALF